MHMLLMPQGFQPPPHLPTDGCGVGAGVGSGVGAGVGTGVGTGVGAGVGANVVATQLPASAYLPRPHKHFAPTHSASRDSSQE